MKVAAAQVKAIRASEQKQKQSEDKLAQILLDFIKSQQNNSALTEFLEHISTLLALNFPAAFILSLILLYFEELQQKAGLILSGQTSPDLALITPDRTSIPPELMPIINSWIQEIYKSALNSRAKLLKFTLSTEQFSTGPVNKLMAHTLKKFLEKNEVYQYPGAIEQFTAYYLRGLAQELQKEPSEIEGPNS